MTHPYSGARVGVVMGGWSGEHDVSLDSGSAIAAALASKGYDVAHIVIPPSSGTSAIELLRSFERAQVDVVFNALHGRLGEDGCLQGMLELAKIPYTGPGVLSSALAMDKVKSKELFLLHNVPTPTYYTVSVDDDLADIESIHRNFGFPVVVKPSGEGSSLAVAKVHNTSELTQALTHVFDFDDEALVERFIAGAEVNVGILDGRVLGAIEICPHEGIYDYHAKYTAGATDYHMPARLPPARYQNVLNLARRAAEALNCTGAVRVDLLVTPGENEYVLEVNTLPGMTQTSLLPKIASAAGYSFAELCDQILASATTHTPQREEQDPTVRRSGTVMKSIPPGVDPALDIVKSA